MKILGVIPARYASTRLPGKPLADINGKPMIQHVYERARKQLERVIVATDDERIEKAVKNFGGEVLLTSKDHNSGTNRCLEAYQAYYNQTDIKMDVVVNIQGDEPMLEPRCLYSLTSAFEDDKVQVATLAVKASDPEDLINENNVFVVIDRDGNALYFSRSPLPHVRSHEIKDWLDHATIYKHVGLYAYRPEALRNFANKLQSALEKAEMLEQLRWLEDGKDIRVEIISHAGVAVDTPADLEKVRKLMN